MRPSYLLLVLLELLRGRRVNYEPIIKHLLPSDFEVRSDSYGGRDVIRVSFDLNDRTCQLIHFCVEEIHCLPQFFLVDYVKFGQLAHVIPSKVYEELGSICVNQLDSVSVNFERPELVFEESVTRHAALLNNLVNNPKFNEDELLREYQTNWYLANEKLMGSFPKTVYCESYSGGFDQVQLYRPLTKDRVMSIPASFVALGDRADESISMFLSRESRQPHKNSICCVVPLEFMEPYVPTSKEELKQWVLDCLSRLSEEVKTRVQQEIVNKRTKEYWLLLNFLTPSGRSWVGVTLSNANKRSFPDTKPKMSNWKIEPVYVDVFNKELLMPRSGANTNLSSKRVLLFGCGSVGSELADKLGAAGVGHLTLVDPDTFSTSNLYRHTLNKNFTNWPKPHAVSWSLSQKYPWIQIKESRSNLLELREKELLESYDIVVVAIGNPTHERIFHDYLAQYKVRVPVIYTWLEGYGVGGHAVLDVPKKQGCLRCAYVEPETGTRGLASNLNFLESDQCIVKNYAGCGEMFIPYGATSSTQTALIAADLAISYLERRVKESTKCSWKGGAQDALSEGLRLSRRFEYFDSSLKKQLLRHPLCDVCNSAPSHYYVGPNNLRVYIPNSIVDQLLSYRQTERDMPEAAGLVIGLYKADSEIWLDSLTLPKDGDKRLRSYFKLDAPAHQQDVDDAYESSDQILGYVGTWHTHPEPIPSPSGVDRQDWKEHESDNPDRPLVFIVVGIEKVSVYSSIKGKITELVARAEEGVEE